MKHPHIPRDWTGEQALLVLDWLQGLLDAIWDTYSDELVEELAKRRRPPDEHLQQDPWTRSRPVSHGLRPRKADEEAA